MVVNLKNPFLDENKEDIETNVNSIFRSISQMWREESGFLEMFLAYYSQFEENLTGKKAYRDFLLEVLGAREEKMM